MTFINMNTEAPLSQTLVDRFAAMSARIGAAFEAYAYRYGRLDQVDALRAKSDAELRAMGLTRDRIVHYVYRDRIGF